MSKYSTLLNTARRRKSDTKSENPEMESMSDKSRVIYSPAFRRMQQKAQVFSLETNASVRSRLTHTLEVADCGKRIALGVSDKLIALNLLDYTEKDIFVNMAETACLMHDIGNPPFGHFGEEAIKRWFNNNSLQLLQEAGIEPPKELKNTRNDPQPKNTVSSEYKMLCDFLEFDGNPQGFRIATHLSGIKTEDYIYGLNLTYAQLAAFVKYTRLPGVIKAGPFGKKPGYFYTEEQIYKEVLNNLKISERHPIDYIMEAADDISYCRSDIEDGIEKNIVTPSQFFIFLKIYFEDQKRKIFENEFKHFISTICRIDLQNATTEYDFFKFKIGASNTLNKKAIDTYIKNEPSILNGSFFSIMEDESFESELLKCLKIFARTFLFVSPEAENMEIAGFHIISGLLDDFKPLLSISSISFMQLVKNEKVKKLDIEKRLLNKLPEKYIAVYLDHLKNLNLPTQNEEFKEWYLRAHLIVDYISGMTDSHSFEIHKLFKGIEV
ncbi:MAG: dGTPase [Saprospiraceae bacterium]|jgi:dGTPase|nr:dGTPase [Saprospiraceae bacterium]